MLVLESSAPGGQAGSSSKIENYLGFPVGDFRPKPGVARPCPGPEVRGPDHGRAAGLAADLRAQAIRGRARYELRGPGSRDHHRVRAPSTESCRSRIRGDSMALASTTARRPWKRRCARTRKSSWSAAEIPLARRPSFWRRPRHVHMLVRSDGLAESMSRYLIRRIEQHDAIDLHVRTEIVAMEGDRHLEEVTWRDAVDRRRSDTPDPTRLRDGRRHSQHEVARRLPCARRKGFIKTGPDLTREELEAARWPLPRPPYLLETACPECSRSAMSGAETSSASHQRWERGRWRWRSSIACCAGES